MNSYAETLRELYQLEAFGIRLGLESVTEYCSRAGHPERSYPTVHIAGTNGKGTTANCLAALATAHGYRTGCYTSPHLVDFRERVRVDGETIPEKDVIRGWSRIADFVRERGMTFFEATTLIVFEYFADESLDLAVVEVGLGGRLDATNVVRPDLTLVTSIALEHEQHLGSELSMIAREKAGIFKPGVPALVGDWGPRAVEDALRGVADAVGSPLAVLSDEASWDVTEMTPGATRFDYVSTDGRLTGLEVPLTGKQYADTAALGIRAWERFSSAPIDEASARAALAGLRMAGRGEWTRWKGIPVLLDVAHNPTAMERFAATVGELDLGKVAVVVGIVADKPWKEMLDTLEVVTERMWFCGLTSALPRRRVSAEDGLRAVAGRRGAEWADDVGAGLESARAAARRREVDSIVVTGSFHTVGEALVVIGAAREGKPYAPEESRKVTAAARDR